MVLCVIIYNPVKNQGRSETHTAAFRVASKLEREAGATKKVVEGV